MFVDRRVTRVKLNLDIPRANRPSHRIKNPASIVIAVKCNSATACAKAAKSRSHEYLPHCGKFETHASPGQVAAWAGSLAAAQLGEGGERALTCSGMVYDRHGIVAAEADPGFRHFARRGLPGRWMYASGSRAISGIQRRTYSPRGSNFSPWVTGLKMRK